MKRHNIILRLGINNDKLLKSYDNRKAKNRRWGWDFVQFGTFSLGPKALDVYIKNRISHYAIWVNSN
jgi:hypothetical protein